MVAHGGVGVVFGCVGAAGSARGGAAGEGELLGGGGINIGTFFA